MLDKFVKTYKFIRKCYRGVNKWLEIQPEDKVLMKKIGIGLVVGVVAAGLITKEMSNLGNKNE